MRYIDADKLIAHLKDEIEECCEQPYGGRINGKSVAYGTVLGLKSAISFAETLSTTDVVPKNEVEKIFEEIEKILKRSKATHCGQQFYYTIIDIYLAELKEKYTKGQ